MKLYLLLSNLHHQVHKTSSSEEVGIPEMLLALLTLGLLIGGMKMIESNKNENTGLAMVGIFITILGFVSGGFFLHTIGVF